MPSRDTVLPMQQNSGQSQVQAVHIEAAASAKINRLHTNRRRYKHIGPTQSCFKVVKSDSNVTEVIHFHQL